MNVGIYIYNQAEVLDFSGPYEVFATAARLQEQCFNVFFIAQSKAPVIARAGFTILPTYEFTQHPHVDILIMPGGVHDGEMENQSLMHWVRDVSASCKIVASVCTGAFILAQAEIFKSQKVTTHWQDLDDLRSQFPTLDVQENVRWVEDGGYISSAGISAGIDMSLHIVARTQGLSLARQTARQMEYDVGDFS